MVTDPNNNVKSVTTTLNGNEDPPVKGNATVVRSLTSDFMKSEISSVDQKGTTSVPNSCAENQQKVTNHNGKFGQKKSPHTFTVYNSNHSAGRFGSASTTTKQLSSEQNTSANRVKIGDGKVREVKAGTGKANKQSEDWDMENVQEKSTDVTTQQNSGPHVDTSKSDILHESERVDKKDQDLQESKHGNEQYKCHPWSMARIVREISPMKSRSLQLAHSLTFLPTYSSTHLFEGDENSTSPSRHKDIPMPRLVESSVRSSNHSDDVQDNTSQTGNGTIEGADSRNQQQSNSKETKSNGPSKLFRNALDKAWSNPYAASDETPISKHGRLYSSESGSVHGKYKILLQL